MGGHGASGRARHLVEQLDAGATKQFETVFDVVERWYCEGYRYVKGGHDWSA